MDIVPTSLEWTACWQDGHWLVWKELSCRHVAWWGIAGVLLWGAQEGFSEERKSKWTPKGYKRDSWWRWTGEGQDKNSGRKELVERFVELLVTAFRRQVNIYLAGSKVGLGRSRPLLPGELKELPRVVFTGITQGRLFQVLQTNILEEAHLCVVVSYLRPTPHPIPFYF